MKIKGAFLSAAEYSSLAGRLPFPGTGQGNFQGMQMVWLCPGQKWQQTRWDSHCDHLVENIAVTKETFTTEK